MRAKEVKPNTEYTARVSGERQTVRTVSQYTNGDWRCVNVKTGRDVRKSARQLAVKK